MSSTTQQFSVQQLEQQPQSQRRRPRNGRALKYPLQHSLGLSNKRIYDLRRWHRRKSNEKAGLSDGGQPPAGWVLVWAGRFKRWQRRWFVAHAPGLVLYYKNSDQLGRPGCINLQGADVLPMTGKERQLKIRRGSRVYYLRTLNRENRQAWLETLNASVGTYEKVWQEVGVGSKQGAALSLQESIPSHLVEEWREQEREINSRLAQRMQQLEPMRQAFLQQLQALQQSLSVISGALGFTTCLEGNQSVPATATGSPIDVVLRRSDVGFRRSDIGIRKSDVGYRSDVGLRKSPRSSVGDLEALSHMDKRAIPVVKFQDTPSRSNQREPTIFDSQSGLVSVHSEPIPGSNYTDAMESVLERYKLKEQEAANGDSPIVAEQDFLYDQGSCMGREFFRRRRRRRNRNGANSSEKEHSSDTEVLSLCNSNIPPLSDQDIRGNNDDQLADLPASRSVDRFPWAHAEYSSERATIFGNLNDSSRADTGGLHKAGEHDSGLSNGGGTQSEQHSTKFMKSSTNHYAHGELHAAWNTMQDAFAEILKEEIQRVIELEAENAVLQQSLAILPQLQQDHRELLDLKRSKVCTTSASKAFINGEYSDDEDTDDEVSMAQSDVTNEDYYEALEVLNQHEFIAKAASQEELEVLAERGDFAHDPPEEGDLSVDVENLSEVEGEEYEQPRTRLPTPRPLSRGFSLWSVLKNAIGKDLNHITMPATINEPLSVLQRCAEELQYGPLLEKASHLSSSIERLVWVSVFACATYHGSPHRDAKPFNPLLGETYEWQAPDGKTRFIAEQVSHHPPVLAFHCENIHGDYAIYGEVEIKNKFWGKSVEVLPAGVVHLRIPRFEDHFTWSKITTCIHNVVLGKLWIDNYGELTIKNHLTGEFSRIKFQKASSTEQGCLTGKIYDNKGAPVCSIHGNYMKEILVTPDPSWNGKGAYGDTECLWVCPNPPEDYEQQYCFSRFTIGLNELTPKLRDVLPPTDSRFRPDQRALEDGDLDKATPEKLRLEEKQREARKKRKELGQEWKCLWFEARVPGMSQVNTSREGNIEPTWGFNGQYWDAREKQDWSGCPDIM